MAGDLVTIKVSGAKELRRAARNAGDDAKGELKDAHKQVADRVARRAERLAPRRSGALAGSVRGLGSQSKAQVAAGRGRTRDYAGVIHYGWPARNIEPNPYLTDAVSDEMADVRDEIEDRYRRLARRLETT